VFWSSCCQVIADLDSRPAEHSPLSIGNLGVLGCLPTKDPALSLLVGVDSLSTVAVGLSTPGRAFERAPQPLPEANRTGRHLWEGTTA